MRPQGVEVPAPALNGALGVLEIGEPVDAETFATELAVEALDERVLDRFAGSDELQRDAALVGPDIEGPSGELRPVVHPEAK